MKPQASWIKQVEKRVGFSLPVRYRRFYETGEYAKYPSARVDCVASYQHSAVFKVRFDQWTTLSSLFDRKEIASTWKRGLVPLSLLAGEPQFLVVDLKKRACP